MVQFILSGYTFNMWLECNFWFFSWWINFTNFFFFSNPIKKKVVLICNVAHCHSPFTATKLMHFVPPDDVNFTVTSVDWFKRNIFKKNQQFILYICIWWKLNGINYMIKCNWVDCKSTVTIIIIKKKQKQNYRLTQKKNIKTQPTNLFKKLNVYFNDAFWIDPKGFGRMTEFLFQIK